MLSYCQKFEISESISFEIYIFNYLLLALRKLEKKLSKLI